MPRVVITFDDAYHGAVTTGIEELAKRALPATIFVPPAFVGGRSFWWDAFADPEAPEPLADLRRYALEELHGADHLVRDWADRSGVPAHPVQRHALTATEDELRIAVSQPGIELASHSWSHPNLTQLGESELMNEMRRPLEWLRERFEAVVPWLSYPYGMSSPNVEKAATVSGYEGALALGGGWLRSERANRFQLPRLNVPAGLSLNGFALRLAGLPLR
ncbi:MAG: polysaccharide deacetylase family protein [Gemmatimonadota bacterium]|nr:polysaccharide deacetylase family protein [Gemmatimonadota bacterium]